MLIGDIVLKARRILGDVDKHSWSDERMLDIVNDGLRDIAKFTGTYRKEHFFEVGQLQSRYPLPLDVIQVTSVEYNGDEVDIKNQRDRQSAMFVSKDQINIGVLDVKNLPVIPARSKRFKQGPTGDLVPQPANDLWADNVWNNIGIWRDDQIWGSPYFNSSLGEGVISNPLLDPVTGVTTGVAIEDLYENLPNTNFGLLSDIYKVGTITVVPSNGDSFGVLTGLDTNLASDGDKLGSIGTVRNKPYRIAGRYGTVVSVLKSGEYIKTRYKSLPPLLPSLEVSLPLSYTWVSPMINFIVGSALQDDNDANNMQRSQIYLGRYSRELEEEIAMSNIDYSSPSKKYEIKYNGGIKNG